jgi:hypothetical protein
VSARRLAYVLAAPALVGAIAIPSAAAAPPTLRILRTAPLVVRGYHFKPAEHVRVIVLAKTRLSRSTAANANGRLTVTFRAGAVDVCAGFTVRAIGARGSKARVISPPRGCPPAP